MKSRIQLLLSILGLTALISAPAVAQTPQLDNFFDGLPPYNGETLTRPRNPVGERESARNREAEESAENNRPVTTNDSAERYNRQNQSERGTQLETAPMNQEPNQRN